MRRCTRHYNRRRRGAAGVHASTFTRVWSYARFLLLLPPIKRRPCLLHLVCEIIYERRPTHTRDSIYVRIRVSPKFWRSFWKNFRPTMSYLWSFLFDFFKFLCRVSSTGATRSSNSTQATFFLISKARSRFCSSRRQIIKALGKEDNFRISEKPFLNSPGRGSHWPI